MKCNKCSFENKSTNIKCEQCGIVLIDVEKVNNDLEFVNPINNPEEALIKTNFLDLLWRVGLVIIVFTLIPIIIIVLFIFKKANKVVDLDKGNKPITI